MNKELRIRHPDLGLILKTKVEFENNTIKMSPIKFGLPIKASKLEKLLLKFTEIYCYDVLRNNMENIVLQSVEYRKFVDKINGQKTLSKVS